MTMTRPQHYAEAERLLTAASKVYSDTITALVAAGDRPGVADVNATIAMYHAGIAAAQAHATLATVEFHVAAEAQRHAAVAKDRARGISSEPDDDGD